MRCVGDCNQGRRPCRHHCGTHGVPRWYIALTTAVSVVALVALALTFWRGA